MKIEILCTGDEVVLGKTVNTNYSYMAGLLQDMGFSVRWGTTVGDDREILVQVIEIASRRADVVIVNGGLGPTVDDLSQEVAAQAMGVPLILNQQWLDHIKHWYALRGRAMPETNIRQAMLPKGAELIDNLVGTACGFRVNINGAVFFFTPGVPYELKRMFPKQVITQLQAIRGSQQVSIVKRFHTFGLGESRADGLLAGLHKINSQINVKLGFQSHFPELEVKLTIHGEQASVLRDALLPFEDFVRVALDNFIVCENDDTLANVVQQKLRSKNLCMGLLETCTAGKITERLVNGDTSDSILKKSVVIPNKQDVMQLVVGSSEDTSSVFDESEVGKFTEALRKQWKLPLLMVALTGFDEFPSSNNEIMFNVMIVISSETKYQVRSARMTGGIGWVKTGASHLALDCLRRFLLNKPVYQRIDFEQH